MAAETPDKPTEAATPTTEQKQETKPAALGEDDEFEDFPVDDWPEDQTEAAAQQAEGTAGTDGEASKHLWEESWDDDDTSDDFSQQLKEELKKVQEAKGR